MTKYFANEWISDNHYGINHDVRWGLALDIIRHCALVTGKDAGEDSAGRKAIQLMPAEEVATRALDIADHMVNVAEARGWIKPTTVTVEQKAQYAGLLDKLKLYGAYPDKDDKTGEIMKMIAEFTSQPA